VARSFDSGRNLALILERVARNPARENFTLFVDKLDQKVSVFVVNMFDAKPAETAVFFAILADLGIAEKLDIVSGCHSKVFLDR